MRKKLTILSIILLILAGMTLFFIEKETNPTILNIEPITNSEKEVSLEDKIGQMILVGFRGTDETNSSGIISAIKDVKIGGVVLFDYDIPSKSYTRNIINSNQVKNLITYLKSESDIPLFIAVDAEGGLVNRLKPKYGFLDIESPKEMAKNNSVGKEATKLAAELKDLGFNFDFAPVVDVDINPQNPVIGGLERSFSSDYNEVIVSAETFITALHEKGIITSAKHFPGHGSSTSDSHLGMVDVTDTYKQDELNPYKSLQKAGLLDTVMTAHIINENIDPNYPATLSPLFLQNILRKEIGFNGVIISDDMQMGAIAKEYGFREAIIRAVNSGCDIILASNNSGSAYDERLAYNIKNIILDAVRQGKISKERIGESYDRIIKLKKDFKIIN